MSFTKSQASAILAALAAAPALVSAHGHVTQITINGEVFPGFQPGNPSTDSVGWATTATDNGFVPVSSLGDGDIVCHRGATNAANSATVAAGDTITITWDTWPESHVGPIIDYLASCDGDCTSVEKTALEFFKIQEGGLLDGTSAPGRWVTDELIEDGFTWETTIPPSVAPGSYVLRHEIVALHEGNQQGGAQMYPQCINLEITGSGSEQPAGVVATELYTADDAGIFFNPYEANLSYEIPGPANSFDSGSGGSPSPAPSTPAGGDEPATPSASPAEPPAGDNTAAPSPTTLATSTRAQASPTAQPPANGGEVGAVALYGQCGGIEYTGATTCAEGSCKKLNDYYHQCYPTEN
ncbi:glycosyl hydrolase family 61 domain-containing protein [Sarocladium implicatum]|nr:glycosyl hydrolase family 61 domain-containing protein [Sarocladium implicatum]